MKGAACLYGVAALLVCVFLAGCIEKPAGETETIMLPGDVPLEMVWMPKGSFTMGSPDPDLGYGAFEVPQHTVKFSAGFWMGKYELTKRQWEAVMETTPWEGQPNVQTYPESPAVYVSWKDAKDFVGAINALTGKTFRLPTEAEWEYACRAGTTTRLYWGDDPGNVIISDYAWWNGNAWSAGEKYAHVVGLKLPNVWGLHDMSGNVLEWCEDDRHDNYTGAPTEGQAWVDGPRGPDRVVRGGGWGGYFHDFLSASRNFTNPTNANYSIGFRLAR
jgi:formylglycine-generating enzyme required for sulfatase activity